MALMELIELISCSGGKDPVNDRTMQSCSNEISRWCTAWTKCLWLLEACTSRMMYILKYWWLHLAEPILIRTYGTTFICRASREPEGRASLLAALEACAPTAIEHTTHKMTFSPSVDCTGPWAQHSSTWRFYNSVLSALRTRGTLGIVRCNSQWTDRLACNLSWAWSSSLELISVGLAYAGRSEP